MARFFQNHFSFSSLLFFFSRFITVPHTLCLVFLSSGALTSQYLSTLEQSSVLQFKETLQSVNLAICNTRPETVLRTCWTDVKTMLYLSSSAFDLDVQGYMEGQDWQVLMYRTPLLCHKLHTWERYQRQFDRLHQLCHCQHNHYCQHHHRCRHAPLDYHHHPDPHHDVQHQFGDVGSAMVCRVTSPAVRQTFGHAAPTSLCNSLQTCAIIL